MAWQGFQLIVVIHGPMGADVSHLFLVSVPEGKRALGDLVLTGR